MSSDRGTTQPAGTGAGTFSAADLKRRMAEREAAKAAEELQRMRAQEEKQKAVMAEFHKPPERTPEQVMQLVTTLVNHAAEAGQIEVQVYRFPNRLCKDRGHPLFAVHYLVHFAAALRTKNFTVSSTTFSKIGGALVSGCLASNP